MNELTSDEHKILVDAIHDSATVVHKGRMMNERIEQLLAQARAECFRFGNKPATTVGYDELEKFAELISKEQIEICRDMFIVGSVCSSPKASCWCVAGIGCYA